MTLDRTDVMEIGLNSLGPAGWAILGRDIMQAFFHFTGTVEVRSERLIRCARDEQINGAASCKNQAGTKSRPVAVILRESNNLNTLKSENTLTDGDIVAFRSGALYRLSVDMLVKWSFRILAETAWHAGLDRDVCSS